MTDPHRPRDTPGPDTPGTAPRTPERRKGAPKMDDATLLAGLTPEQQATIHTMETFHWRLKFVRRPLFKIPVPVRFNREVDRPELCRHSVAALRVAPFKLYR